MGKAPNLSNGRTRRRGGPTLGRLAGRIAVIAGLLSLPVPTGAQASDYDVDSSDWNGLHELVTIAQENSVDLRTGPTFDWSRVRRGDGVLVLYPLIELDLSDVSAFVEDGGRLAVFDDYGQAASLLRRFEVTRTEDPAAGPSRSHRVPGLIPAVRHSEHPLAEGVDEFMTNEPISVAHPRLSPVFALGESSGPGVVLVGQVGRGHLVVSGDPSALINTMMRFPGNRQFARNLLVYLSGGTGGRVHLVHSAFRVRGSYRGAAPTTVRRFVHDVDARIAQLRTLFAAPGPVLALALFVALLAVFLLGIRTWGSRPSDRFGPTAPVGLAASIVDKVAVFSAVGANLLYPALVARRYLERSLRRHTRAHGASATTRLPAPLQTEIHAVLQELDSLVDGATDGPPPRMGARRFLSLWKRIGAILARIGEGP